MEMYLKMLDFLKKREKILPFIKKYAKTSKLSYIYIDRFEFIHVRCRVRIYLVRINFYLLRTIFLILVVFVCCFFFHYVSAKLHLWPDYDTKQSDGEVPEMQWFGGMRSTPSLPLLPSPLWPGVVAPDRTLSMGKIRTNGITYA